MEVGIAEAKVGAVELEVEVDQKQDGVVDQTTEEKWVVLVEMGVGVDQGDQRAVA